jgi:hypothetical protein
MSKQPKGGRDAFFSHLPSQRARVGVLELEQRQASAQAPAPPDSPPARHEHVARID